MGHCHKITDVFKPHGEVTWATWQLLPGLPLRGRPDGASPGGILEPTLGLPPLLTLGLLGFLSGTKRDRQETFWFWMSSETSYGVQSLCTWVPLEDICFSPYQGLLCSMT